MKFAQDILFNVYSYITQLHDIKNSRKSHTIDARCPVLLLGTGRYNTYDINFMHWRNYPYVCMSLCWFHWGACRIVCLFVGLYSVCWSYTYLYEKNGAKWEFKIHISIILMDFNVTKWRLEHEEGLQLVEKVTALVNLSLSLF